jgi:hypothetical protein
MDHDLAYKLRATKGASAEKASLYSASKALAACDSRTDSSHVCRGGRAVAYFCEWRGVVRPMFQATPQERDALLLWEIQP